jgi:hypothetical protein
MIQLARADLVRTGASSIQVIDGAYIGRGSKWKKPVPDVVATIGERRVAVECGYLANRNRLEELRAVGYEVVIHWPYLEFFDPSMMTPEPLVDSDFSDKPRI